MQLLSLEVEVLVLIFVDEEWAVRIRTLKFEAFNQEWLEAIVSPDQVKNLIEGFLKLVFTIIISY